LSELSSHAELLTARTRASGQGLRLALLVGRVKASELTRTGLVGHLTGVVQVAEITSLDVWINLSR
jgi:hypothetical protein